MTTARPGASSSRLRPVADGAVNILIKEPGRFFGLVLYVFRAMFKWPFQWREFIQQAWFIVGVTERRSAIRSRSTRAGRARRSSPRGRLRHP